MNTPSHLELVNSQNTELKFWKTQELCRQKINHIIARKNILIQSLLNYDTPFQTIDADTLNFIQTECKNITFQNTFNNFIILEKFIHIFEFQYPTTYNPEADMRKLFIDLYHQNHQFHHTDCVVLSQLLKNTLGTRGISSYLVRFSAFWYHNDEYMKDGHVGLIIPANIDWINNYIFVDPWIRIITPIIFNEHFSNIIFCDNRKIYITKNDNNSEYTHSLHIIDKNNNIKNGHFNHTETWINPDEVIPFETLRARSTYKIHKFTENENTIFFFDIATEMIILILKNMKYIFSLQDFVTWHHNNTHSQQMKAFKKSMKILEQDEIQMQNNLIMIHKHLHVFKKSILI